MSNHLPPLTSVRAFEAAARNGSMTQAADELCVTPAAITHQVRSLERWLGVKLFDRKGSLLRLTTAGQNFYIGANRGIDAIRAAAEQVAKPQGAKQLSITAPPSFAAQWLVPRLFSFQNAHNFELSVAIRTPQNESDWDSSDIGIVSGVTTPSHLERRPIFRYRIIAVCSPELLKGPQPINSLADLRYHQLLHDEGLRATDGIDWSVWLRRLGAEPFDTSGTMRFGNAFAAYRFARDGHGVVLAKDVLVKDDLKRGNLVNPFNVFITSERTYDFVCPRAKARSRPISQFWNWMISEARDGNFELDASVA